MGSVQIRVSEYVKKRIDNYRKGQTIRGKWGYERKMTPDDVIKGILNDDWTASVERCILQMMYTLATHEEHSPAVSDPYSLLSVFVKYLELWLKHSDPRHFPDRYNVYKDLHGRLSILIKSEPIKPPWL